MMNIISKALLISNSREWTAFSTNAILSDRYWTVDNLSYMDVATYFQVGWAVAPLKWPESSAALLCPSSLAPILWPCPHSQTVSVLPEGLTP